MIAVVREVAVDAQPIDSLGVDRHAVAVAEIGDVDPRRRRESIEILGRDDRRHRRPDRLGVGAGPVDGDRHRRFGERRRRRRRDRGRGGRGLIAARGRQSLRRPNEQQEQQQRAGRAPGAPGAPGKAGEPTQRRQRPSTRLASAVASVSARACSV